MLTIFLTIFFANATMMGKTGEAFPPLVLRGFSPFMLAMLAVRGLSFWPIKYRCYQPYYSGNKADDCGYQTDLLIAHWRHLLSVYIIPRIYVEVKRFLQSFNTFFRSYQPFGGGGSLP